MCEITKTYECALPYPSWKCVSWAIWKCKDKIELLQKDVTTSGCHLWASNPTTFTILDPEGPKWKNADCPKYVQMRQKPWDYIDL
jgi:hypothetical protein